MKTLILLWLRLKAKWLIKRAKVVYTYTPATVAQLVYEYDHLDEEHKKQMLEWAKDPKNPNPNAIDFYNNIKRFG